MAGKGGKAACEASTDRALGSDIAADFADFADDAGVGLICATCLLRVMRPQLRWPHLDGRADVPQLRRDLD